MIRTLFLILFTAFISTHSALGQEFYVKNYTVNNGLPSDCIQDIYKDKRGFLWLATDAGLCRFDGGNFNIYTSQDGLIGDKVRTITEDEIGNIWVGCYDGGITKISGKEFISYNISSGLISNEVTKIHYSLNSKILLIGTDNGLTIYENNKFISFHQKLKNVKERLQITGFLEEEEFIYVFTKGNGLYKYTPKTQKINRITDNKINRQKISAANVSQIGDTIYNFNYPDFNTLRKVNSKTYYKFGYITNIKEDLDNNIWIAVSGEFENAGGLFKYDSSGINNFGKYLNISTKNILSLEFDPLENLLWIGTKDDGLYLYPLYNFTYYKPDFFGVNDLNIIDLKIDEFNNIWIASPKDIIKKTNKDEYEIFNFDLFKSRFDSFVKNKIKQRYNYLIDKKGSFKKYQQEIANGRYSFPNPYKKINKKELPAGSLYKPLKYDVLVNKRLKSLNSINIDSNNNIWVGSNVGIFRIEEKTNHISYYDMEGNQFNSFSIDSKNKVYGTSWSDLFIYPNIVGNSNYQFFNYYEQKSPINIVKTIFNDNKIWFASSDHGLFLYNEDKFYSTYVDKKINYHSFNDICVDREGNVIIGANNGKIYIVEFLNDSLQLKLEIDKNSGLKGTNIRYLNCTKENLLIVGTNTGLNLIDLNILYEEGRITVETLGESKGFVDYTGQVSLVQDSTYLWIGTKQNLIKVDLNDIEAKRYKGISLYIKSFEINNEKIDLTSLTDVDEWTKIPKSNLELPHNKNSITISYDALMYLDHQSAKFSYKLEGYHKKWINESKNRKLVFQNLNPGKYGLRIKVLNDNENIARQELLFSFTILNPYWYTWWFISLITVFILTFIWLLIYLRSNSIKKIERQRTELSERISEFEMKAFRAQMNPHFIFNVINSIQNYMLDNDVDAALSYLSDFAKLIRLSLDNVSKKLINLDDELKYLEYYINLEQMRFDKKFETEIIIPNEFENRRFLIPSMILRPYVENSIKHGFPFKMEGGKIHIEFLLTENNMLKCIIEDNGIGREKARELNKNKMNHSSKGTFIANERLSLLNQTQQKKGFKVEIIDLFDDDDIARGTRVEIFIPI